MLSESEKEGVEGKMFVCALQSSFIVYFSCKDN